MSERDAVFMRRLEELKSKYEGYNEFDLITILHLEDEYNHLLKVHPEYTKRRAEILKMRSELLSKLDLISQNPIKTISLFDQYENKDYINTSLQDGSIIHTANMSDILQNRLATGERQRALIDVTGFRGIGKTHELVRFAKDRGYFIIVHSTGLANLHKRKYGYGKFFGQNAHLQGTCAKFVVDEGVDVKKLMDDGIDIVTGYIGYPTST